MKTKFFIITLLTFLSGTVAYAQREILPVDWKELKKVVRDEPGLVKSLVERLTATVNSMNLLKKHKKPFKLTL